MEEFNSTGDVETYSVEDGEVRFVLYLDVVSAKPSNHWFRAGHNAAFGIHDPARWFGTDQEKEIRGQRYHFVMVIAQRFTKGMKRRSTLVSVERMEAEPVAAADGEDAAAEP